MNKRGAATKHNVAGKRQKVKTFASLKKVIDMYNKRREEIEVKGGSAFELKIWAPDEAELEILEIGNVMWLKCGRANCSADAEEIPSGYRCVFAHQESYALVVFELRDIRCRDKLDEKGAEYRLSIRNKGFTSILVPDWNSDKHDALGDPDTQAKFYTERLVGTRFKAQMYLYTNRATGAMAITATPTEVTIDLKDKPVKDVNKTEITPANSGVAVTQGLTVVIPGSGNSNTGNSGSQQSSSLDSKKSAKTEKKN